MTETEVETPYIVARGRSVMIEQRTQLLDGTVLKGKSRLHSPGEVVYLNEEAGARWIARGFVHREGEQPTIIRVTTLDCTPDPNNPSGMGYVGPIYR